MLQNIPDDIKRDSTVVRIRGELYVGQPPDTVARQLIWYVGMVVVSEDAMSAAGASLPDPEFDDADWMYYRSGFYRTGIYEDSAGALREVDPGRYLEVDSKAMRKLPEDNRTLAYVFKNDASSDDTIRQAISARILLKRA